jgi:hypothetical protein
VATARLHCSESIHFVGLAISACLLPSSPRPTCTADSSAALRASAPVHSLVHAWPCSAPLQPLLPLPFPAPPLLVIFCAHLTFHHSLSCPISHFPPRFPYAFLTSPVLRSARMRCAHFGTFTALTRGLSAFHFFVCPAGGTVGNASFCSFQRAQEHSNLTTFLYCYCCMSCRVYKLNESTYGQQNQLSTPVLFD